MGRAIVSLLVALGSAAGARAQAPALDGITGSPHDLSPAAEGRGAGACAFCHMGHGAPGGPPAWDRGSPVRQFRMYSSANSSTFLVSRAGEDSAARPVGDVSLSCLTCHDGTIGPAAPNQPPSFATRGGRPIGAGGDLTADHPISFTYDTALSLVKGGGRAGGLRDPATTVVRTTRHRAMLAMAGTDLPAGAGGGTVAEELLYPRRGSFVRDQVECVSCHDPHVRGDPADPQGTYPFLVITNARSQLCLACHAK